MRIKPEHSPFLANKIAIDLINAPFVKLLKGKDAVVERVKEIIDEHLEVEKELDNKVNEIIDENYDDIELQNIDERQLFFMIKKKLAPEFGIIMDYDERYNDLSHKILDELYENYLIEYEANENQVKNVIFKAFRSFANIYNEVDDIVRERIERMKKRYIPGSEEYYYIYEKLMKEELRRRGVL